MSSSGWKMKPLGWIVIAVMAGLAVYFLGKGLRNVTLGKRSNVTLGKQTDE